MIRLRVWANVRPMGWFGHEAGEFFFEYDPQWLSQTGGYVLAPQFALKAQRYTGVLVKTFFENLLPEGEALEDVIAAIELRDASAFDLLGRLGQELPGVLSLLPYDAQASHLQSYQKLEYVELSKRLQSRNFKPLMLSNEHATMSLAGAQDKMGVRFDPKTHVLSDSIGTSPTTHILKPDTRQIKYQPSAINEFACMKLAKALKLPVPDVWLLHLPEPVYLIERYDREVVSGNIVPLHQIDGCQLLGHGSGWKYQRSAGLVSLPKLVAALRGLKVRASDMLQFQRWVMFNYLIGNADAHGKNMSVLIDDEGYRLAPFYDLLCVCVYGDAGLALFIGDEETFDAVGRHSWEAFCQDCGFRLPEFLKEFRIMAEKLLPAWQKVCAEIEKKNEPAVSEKALLARMTIVFEEQVKNAMSMTAKLS
jgi:serine/threonine-protein kinase HipA